MSRRDTLKAMLSRRDSELPRGNPETSDVDAAPLPEKKFPHVRSGAVGAMGRSLGNIVSAAEHARALVAEGSAVVEIAADKIESSFIADRLPDDGDRYESLFDAIKESGQKSPVLLRPHPEKPDRFQVAFGHRRVRVLAALGRPVKAVVQSLTDEELVIIQGQENSARTDLSYIERGLFALALEERGFSRQVIMTSLRIEKTQLSRLMTITSSIPRVLIEAIGAAPKAGRPRWAALADKLGNAKKSQLDELLGSSEFRALDTDSRFQKVMDALTPKKGKERAEVIKAEDGKKLASVQRSANTVSVVFEDKSSAEFANYVVEKLASLHHEFLTTKGN